MPATEISAQAPSRLMQDAVRAGASPANPAFNQPRYKVWDGRNKFFCGGRIVAGPEPAPVVVTSLMIIGPVLVSLIQTYARLCDRDLCARCRVWAVWVWVDVRARSSWRASDPHPCRGYLSNEWVNTELDNPASTIIMIVLAVWSLVELWMTALSDPGIIPRVDKFTRRKLGYLHRRLPPDVQTVFASGRHTTLKHCTICELFKPPRAEHCPVCDNCVMQFDVSSVRVPVGLLPHPSTTVSCDPMRSSITALGLATALASETTPGSSASCSSCLFSTPW